MSRRRAARFWLPAGLSILIAAIGIAALVTQTPRRTPRKEHPDLPGIDVNGLDANQFQLLLAESKQTPCVCGCGFTLADCRHKDPTCPRSGPILAEMVERYRSQGAGK